MMEAGDAGLGAGPGRRWDVALSFGGAQRDYVAQVAGALKARGVRCFFDADEQVRLWGTHLAEELPRIYARESAAVVVFVSADYAAGDWTRLERRAAFSHAVREAGVFVLPARFDDSELPGLLPDVACVDLRRHTPEQFADLVAAKLADLALSPPLTSGQGRGPVGGVRVSDADPRRLGVHAAISVPGLPDDVLPQYVPRDADAAEAGVRVKVAAAAKRGGFVLLIGGSSVGKTRCVAEAVRALLPDWWLVHPAGPTEVAALAAAPFPRLVVWLDELQRYLDGDLGVTGGMVRALLNAADPVVIIGTLWPERFDAYTTLPAPGGTDPRAREREVLDLADLILIRAAFSPAEQERARAAAARDLRLQLALKAAGYGLTQTLAAAPQLVARWENAQDTEPYAWAVLTAALDAARLGARAPLSADFLRAAAPGYCTSQQQAEAPGNWSEQALAYATGKLLGAAAALVPAGTGMGLIAGYTVADYLLQHASRERRHARVPASTWDAAISHIRDPDDAARLAGNANSRLLYRYSIPLYRHAADAGNWWAAASLAELLAERGDLDELRERANSGDEDAAGEWARVLAERGDLDELRELAQTGGWQAAERLARVLAKRGDLDQAVPILRELADAGNPFAAERLAILLAELGDLDELRERADAGDGFAAEQLAGLLAGRGDLDQAVPILHKLAERGNLDAVMQLFGLLIKPRDLDEHGDLGQLRERAGAGDEDAAWQLLELLAKRGDLDGAIQILRGLADAGNSFAAPRLAGLLAERGDLDELRERADAGDQYATRQLALLLAERGDLDELRERADLGNQYAERLAQLLAERADLDELRGLADSGNTYAAERLAGLLAERGDLDELHERADSGSSSAANLLTRLLFKRGDLDELLDRANTGHGNVALGLLTALLIKQDRCEEAEHLRRFGLNPDGSIASA